MVHYTEETENNENANNENTNNSKAKESQSTEPATVTEDAGEIPKPGGKRERNPRKAG